VEDCLFFRENLPGFLKKNGHILTEFAVLGNLMPVVHVLDLLHQGDSRLDCLGATIDYLNDQ
jgi:hypothetical protein